MRKNYFAMQDNYDNNNNNKWEKTLFNNAVNLD